jgi:hypothetical protein
MASRFDQIPQFNPYIQEAPLDLVSQIGMYKQQRYYEGVQKVQSYVDSVAGINLARNVDRQYLQGKLQKLSADVSQVVNEDFSNPFLQTKIGNIAHGIQTDDKIVNGIMGTNELLQKKAQINDIRTKNSAAYNPNNDVYSMIDVQKWMDNPEPGVPLQDNHKYIDYYDYSKEVRDAMKNFKPSKITNTVPKGEWMVTNSDASYTNDEVRRYLEATLSDRAKQQMKIEGVVSFLGRDNELLGSYYSKLKDNVKQNNNLISHYQAQKAGVPKEQQDLLQGKIESLTDENLDNINQYSKIDNRDLDAFNGNKENIASYLFRNAYLDQAARGYSHVDVEQSYDPNEIWKAKFTQSMENARLNTRLQFDAQEGALDRKQKEDLKLLELGYKMLGKDGKVKDPQTENTLEKAKTAVTTNNVTESGRSQFNTEVQSLQQDTNNNFSRLRDKILRQSPQLYSQYQQYLDKGGKEYTANDPSTIAAMKYITEQAKLPKSKRDVWADDFIEETNRINTRRAVLDQFKQDIDNQVASNYGREIANAKNRVSQLVGNIEIPVISGAEYNNQGIMTRPGKVTSKITVTPVDILNYLTRADTNSKINSAIANLRNVSDPSTVQYIYQYIDKVRKTAGNNSISAITDALKYENNLYNQSTVNLGDWWTPVGDKDPRVKQAINYIANQAGGKPDEYKVARVNRTTGEIQFKLNPGNAKTTNLNPKLIESLGLVEDKANNTYTMKGVNYFQRDYEGITPTEQELVRALDGNGNIPKGSYYTPPHTYDPNGNGQFIQIVKDLDKDGRPRYWLRSENENMNIDYVNYQDPISAIRAAKTLTSDLQRMKIIIDNKKVIPQ